MLHDLYQELPTAAAAPAPAPAQFQSGPAGRPAHYVPLHTRYACVCVQDMIRMCVCVSAAPSTFVGVSSMGHGNFWQCKATTGRTRPLLLSLSLFLSPSLQRCGECTSVSVAACKRICIGLSQRERVAHSFVFALSM